MCVSLVNFGSGGALASLARQLCKLATRIQEGAPILSAAEGTSACCGASWASAGLHKLRAPHAHRVSDGAVWAVSQSKWGLGRGSVAEFSRDAQQRQLKRFP
eukprot:352193-Chlamydomonas_euryale.AAC.7